LEKGTSKKRKANNFFFWISKYY